MSTKHLNVALFGDWLGRGGQKFFKKEEIKEGGLFKKGRLIPSVNYVNFSTKWTYHIESSFATN